MHPKVAQKCGQDARIITPFCTSFLYFSIWLASSFSDREKVGFLPLLSFPAMVFTSASLIYFIFMTEKAGIVKTYPCTFRHKIKKRPCRSAGPTEAQMRQYRYTRAIPINEPCGGLQAMGNHARNDSEIFLKKCENWGLTFGEPHAIIGSQPRQTPWRVSDWTESKKHGRRDECRRTAPRSRRGKPDSQDSGNPQPVPNPRRGTGKGKSPT